MKGGKLDCDFIIEQVPPGFPSKRDREQVEDYNSEDEDTFTIAKILKLRHKDVSNIEHKDSSAKSSRQCGNCNNSSGTPGSHSSPTAAKISAVAAPVKTNLESKHDFSFHPNQSQSSSCFGADNDETRSDMEKEKQDVKSANECLRASLGDYEKKSINGDSGEAEDLEGQGCIIM
ncbi:hypothetical protein M5689_014288 [Euphorbia peplus]|nr:hypothetical protein M5689_014288 [Euphorbia peplus]